MLFFPLRRDRRPATPRRPRRRTHVALGMEQLESRKLLNGDPNGYIKIDLSNLDQTGLGGKYDIYMLGYASSSGQILQKDPQTGVISLGTPLPQDLVVPVTSSMVKGSSVTLSTSANLFVGGAVTIGSVHTTISSISANVVAGNQPVQNGPYAPYYQTGWTPGNDAVVLQPSAVNQGTVSNPGSGSTVTGVPIAAGTQSGIRLDSIVNGYFPPSGGAPTADATVSGGQVTGFTNLANGGARFQTAPTVSFPGSGVSTVAQGTCTIDPSTGYVTGVNITTPGAGYQTGTTYPAVFSPASPGNAFFYPSDSNGFPGPASASAAATVTSLSSTGPTMSIGLSQAATPPGWQTMPITLGGPALNIYSGGTNASGFATFTPVATVTVSSGVGTVSNVNTLIQFDPLHAPTVIVPSVGIASANWATGTVTLDSNGWLSNVGFTGSPFATYANGTYSIFAVAGNGAEGWSTPSFTIADLPSTSAVQGYNELLGAAGSSLLVAGNSATPSLYAIPTYTITFADPVPVGATSITFSSSVAASVSSDGTTFTISSATYPGIESGLAIGITPTITLSGPGSTTATVTSLSVSGSTITVTLGTALPVAYRSQTVSVALPPTGGTLPAIKWDKDVNNAIWAAQTPSGTTGAISVNGARIYFVLDTLNLGAPQFNYSVAVTSGGQEVISVTQPPDALVWQGKVSPFQYIELTADSMPLSGAGGDGLVYTDLSAVDGFFFPAALSTTIDTNNILLGQPWQAYTAPNATGPSSYNAVTRKQILDAWKASFAPTNFPGASALQQAYLGLAVAAGTGIQNPTFAYASPTTSIPAFDTSWNSALTALFTTSNQINLVGDLTIGSNYAYYKGTQVTVTGGYQAIKFTEYNGTYNTPTGAEFWVYDPRNPPPTETAAFALVNGVNTAMTAGYQVFANTGVFASTSLVQSGNTPNYSPGSSAWSASDALKQLLALQRDIVTALNRGMGAKGIGGSYTTAGSTSTYWNTETNWYPYAAPYSADTPQNLFSQWVHTAVIDQATNTYYATYPFGNLGSGQNFGTPQKSWGSGGAGTGPFMNQTYGFGYDETPNNAANVPSKFLPLPNTAGNQATPLTFSLVFGPWDKAAPTAPTVTSVDTSPPQVGSTPTPTSASSVTWTVTFSEPVKGVTASNFALVPGGSLVNTSITSVTANGGGQFSATWTVTVNTGSGNGTLGLNLTSPNGIVDQSSDPLSLPGGKFTGQVYAVNRPSVSFTLPSTNPTTASTVQFNVLFTQAVTGLTAANFMTVATGVTGASIQSVTGSGTSWTVTVGTGTGSGSLAIAMANSIGVSPTVVNVPVTSPAYTVDKTAPSQPPTVSSISVIGSSTTSAANVSWTVTFSEPVTGLTATNFVLVPGGGLGGTPAITSVTPASSSSTSTWVVTAWAGTGSGTLGLTMQNSTNVHDTLPDQLPVSNVPFTGAVYTINRPTPNIVSLDTNPPQQGAPTPTVASSVTWTVTFNVPVTGVTAANFTLSSGGTLAQTSITSVTAVGGGQYATTWTVGVSTGTGAGILGLALTSATGIVSQSSVPLSLPGGGFTGQEYSVNRPSATIALAGANPTSAATVPFTVTFTQAVTGLTAANFQTVATGVTGASIQSVTGSGTSWTVTVGTGTGSGTLAIKMVNSAGVSPTVVNLPVMSPAYTVNKSVPSQPPTVSSVSVVGSSTTSAPSVSWTVTFSEPVTGVTSANFILNVSGLGGSPAITSVTPASGSSTATWTVTASSGTGTGTLGLTMQNSTNVHDTAPDQLPVSNVPFVGAVYTVNRVAPAVQSINRAGTSPTNQASVSWTVMFSKPVGGVSAQNFNLVSTGLSGAKITQVSQVPGTGTAWTVTAQTGSGNGTLRLDMVNTTGITDQESLPPTGIPLSGQAYQIFRGTATIVAAPISFMTTAGVASKLVWGMPAFTDSDSVQLTATLAIPPNSGGMLRAASRTGVTVIPSGSPAAELQFSGTLAALNAYFSNPAGFITYAPTLGARLTPRTLTLSAQGSDGLGGMTSAALLVRSATMQSPAPAVNPAGVVAGKIGQPVVITYAQLVTATGATQTTSRSIQFMLSGLISGRLEVWTGSRWAVVPSVANIPLLAPGGQIRWTPPAGASGLRAAFTIRTWDGWRLSGPSRVSVNLTR
jgi:hypothetical protein